MYIRYGTYRHYNEEVEVTINRVPEVNDAGVQWAYTERWTLRGRLPLPRNRTNSYGLTPLIQQLEAAYSVDGKDLVLLMPDGATPSAHTLLNKNTLGGTRIAQPISFPDGKGANYVNARTYEVVIEGLVPITSGLSSYLVSFTETLEFSGGGPEFGHLRPRIGLPVKQLLTESLPYRVIQFGSAVGMYGYPTIPSSLWPFALLRYPVISRGSPKRMGNDYWKYPVSWRYEHEHYRRLYGTPNKWGAGTGVGF